MTFQQSFNALITKIQTNFIWLKNNKADANHTHSQYLTSHQSIKTINGQNIVGSGNVEIGGVSGGITVEMLSG